MINENNYAVIMAGGIGSRFWPLSTEKKPKQFIDILDTGKTLIQQTIERLNTICSPNNILIVTNEEYLNIVKEQLPFIPDDNILCEPFRRNTAPCIAYATYKIFLRNKKANIIVSPSDHVILNEDKFINSINHGLYFVKNNNKILTIGITPHRPETGYGYIQKDSKIEGCNNIKKVKTFTEKPDIELAKVFLKSGDFLWNSGIFLWNVNTILKAFKQHLPDLISLFDNGLGYINTNNEKKFIRDIYSNTHSVSIDYGILEKDNNVCVLESEFGWTDLGTWKSFHEQNLKDENGNVIICNKSILIDSNNCIIHLKKDKDIVVQGLSNYIITEHNNTLLICNRNEESRIKKFSEKLRQKD